ncbi:MAG: hypothetical protein AAGD05_11740, partial [Bacteroidota bacterium]
LDLTNIKQLHIELQQSGNVYLDDISLVFYEPTPQSPWMEEEILPNPVTMPIQIFDDAFINNNDWGLITDDCQNITLTNQESTKGQQSVHAKWNDESGTCRLMAFGASWNKWKPVDVTSIRSSVAFQFQLKMASGQATELPISIGFEDYDRAKTGVALKSEFVEGQMYTDQWKLVTIPLSDLPEGVDYTRIKHLFFQLEQSGDVFIDDIRLVNLP